MSESADDMDQQLISGVADGRRPVFPSLSRGHPAMLELAVSSVDDCDFAGILVAADQTVVTRAASDPA